MAESGPRSARPAPFKGIAAFAVFVVFAAVAAFAVGMALLFRERMQSGDIYPEYSTLRSDPKGCRAFFTALQRYPDLDVRRAYAMGDFQGQRPGAAYFFLGLDARAFRFEGESIKELDSLARRGHRVVLAFAPLAHESGDEYLLRRSGLLDRDTASLKDSTAEAARKAKAAGDSALAAKRKAAGPVAPDAMDYLRTWGFRLRVDTAFDAEERYLAFSQDGRDSLPWLSALWLDSLQGPWKVRYRRGGFPVAAERPLGSGSVVLVSDSYFSSNEAQLRTRPAALAAVLLGGGSRVFFDERHHGVRQDDSVAGLLRRYRLHWILPSLLLLFGLYVWKSRFATADRESAGPAEEAAAGLAMAGLLRRNLSDRQALEACYALWKEGESRLAAGGPGGKGRDASGSGPARAQTASDPELSAALDRAKPAGNSTLASAYGGIQAILNRRKRK